MKKILIFTAILALALCLGLPESPEAGGWTKVCIADSLDLTDILGDTVIQVVDWPLTSDVGKVAFLIRETGVTTSSVEATYNFKTVLLEKDADVDTLQGLFYEGATAKTAAVDLLGSDDIWGTIGLPVETYVLPVTQYGGQIFLFITKNDCNAGFIDVYIWAKTE